jgi:hypothetical protein
MKLKSLEELSFTLRFLSQDKTLTNSQLRFLVSWLTDSPSYHRTVKEFERELQLSPGNTHRRVINPLKKMGYIVEIGRFEKKKLKMYFPIMKSSPVYDLGIVLIEKVQLFRDEILQPRKNLIHYEESYLQDEEKASQRECNITKQTKVNYLDHGHYLSLVKAMPEICEDDLNAVVPEYQIKKAMCVAGEE